MTKTPLERWIAEKIGSKQALLSRESLERYQLARLKETLARAKSRSAFYKMRLARLSDQLVSLEQLSLLPFTAPLDVRLHPLQFVCVSQSAISRVVTLQTTGTTGEAKRIFFTGEDQELTVDFFHRGMATLVGPGDKVLILLPGERPGSVGDLLADGLERLGVFSMVYGPVQDYPHALETMRREKFDALVGIPVQVLTLARRSQGRGAPRSVLLSTDYVPEALKDELVRIWGCEVYTHYGMTEMGYGGGVECQARRGYHMREADLLFEIVEPETGNPVKEGETGEVVFTTLTRRGMPFIRYRTGDLGRFLSEPCPCGTVLKTMAPVVGRLANQFMLEPGMFLTMADLDEALFTVPGVVDVSAELSHRHHRNHLTIRVTMVCGANEDRLGQLRNALSGIRVLRTLMEQGTFAFDFVVREGSPQPLTGVTKRTLIDTRK